MQHPLTRGDACLDTGCRRCAAALAPVEHTALTLPSPPGVPACYDLEPAPGPTGCRPCDSGAGTQLFRGCAKCGAQFSSEPLLTCMQCAKPYASIPLDDYSNVSACSRRGSLPPGLARVGSHCSRSSSFMQLSCASTLLPWLCHHAILLVLREL